MIKNGMYIAKQDIYTLIRSVGGVWNDSKERPIYCCLESAEVKGFYWAIPVGSYEHRDAAGRKRIQTYLSLPTTNIGSCYYHIGTTTRKSIFFISDVIPITDAYVDREYKNYYTNSIYIIKNKPLITELEYKLSRILSYEKSNPNCFRQRITDVKEKLIEDLSK